MVYFNQPSVTNSMESKRYSNQDNPGGGGGGLVIGGWQPFIPPQQQQQLYQHYSQGYRDHANATSTAEEQSFLQFSAATPFQMAARCKTSDLVFPVKLHYMLTASERDPELSSIVGWQPHGRCFIVRDRNRFVNEVLSEWFLQKKFESFQRQLNLYGFKRITTGPDRGACYHECFLRNKPFLCQRIERIRLKGNGPRKPALPEEEPNFYKMPWLPTHKSVETNINTNDDEGKTSCLRVGSSSAPTAANFVPSPLPRIHPSVGDVTASTSTGLSPVATSTSTKKTSVPNPPRKNKAPVTAMTRPPTMPQSLVVSSGTPMTATVENKAATSSSPIISEPSSPVTAPPPPATASSITRALWPTLQQQLGQQQQIMMNSSCSEKSTFVARVVSEATLDMTNMNVYNGGNMIARNLKRPTLQPRRQPQTLAEEVAATAPTSGEELDADDFDFAGIISDLAGGRFCDNAAAI